MIHWVRAVIGAILLSAMVALPASAQEWTVEPGWGDEAQLELPPPPAEWTTISGTYLRVHGPVSDTDLLVRLAQHGSAALPELAEALEVPIGKTIHIHLASNDAQFRELQPGNAPTWADATAYPALSTIYLRAPRARSGDPDPLEQVLEHELVHVLLGRVFAPNRPPQWLQEGLAQVYAHQNGPETTHTIARGVLAGGHIGLEELSWGFPNDPVRAQLAYAESADLITWLRVQHGDAVVPELIRELASGAELAAAIRRTTGTTLEQVEAEWSAPFATGSTFTLSALAQSSEVVFALGGMALLVGGWFRRRQFARRLVEMEEEERLVDDLLAQMRANGSSATDSDRFVT